jgi:hypothetical protein
VYRGSNILKAVTSSTAGSSTCCCCPARCQSTIKCPACTAGSRTTSVQVFYSTCIRNSCSCCTSIHTCIKQQHCCSSNLNHTPKPLPSSSTTTAQTDKHHHAAANACLQNNISRSTTFISGHLGPSCQQCTGTARRFLDDEPHCLHLH